MAQIAIPIVLLGVAYLASNDDSRDKKKECSKEGFSFIDEEKNQGNLLANENKDYYPNIDKTKLSTNNQQTISQYQDKYYLNQI